MTTPRHPRNRRRKGVRVRLGARDLDLLRALARLRIAATSDVIHLCFRGTRRDTASVRLRRLYDAGYLDVTAQDRYAENQYSLGPEGRAVIREEGGEVGRVPRGSTAHHLAIVTAWVELANHDLPGARLDLVRADWELREEFADQSLALVPDLFAIFGGDGGRMALSIEVDLATEPIGVLRSKLTRYEAAKRDPNGLFGWTEFSQLVFAPNATAARREAIARLSVAGESGVICATPGDISSALRRILIDGSSPLSDSPYGKGRDARVSHGSDATSRVDGEGH